MAKLDTEARDRLPTGVFGIPETRSYPLNDKNHVMAAIKMFRHAPLRIKNRSLYETSAAEPKNWV